MAITTRKLGQVLNIYEGENGALMCQLLMRRAECCNNFEGLGENGERLVSSELALTIEVLFLDESRCRLRGITEKTFVVHAGDWLEFLNSEDESIARVKVKSISFSSAANSPKDSDIIEVQAGCATDLFIEWDTEFCPIDFKEK